MSYCEALILQAIIQFRNTNLISKKQLSTDRSNTMSSPSNSPSFPKVKF